MDEIDDTVFKIDAGKAEDEGGNGIEYPGVAALGTGGADTHVNLFKNFIIGFEAGRISLTSFIEQIGGS